MIILTLVADAIESQANDSYRWHPVLRVQPGGEPFWSGKATYDRECAEEEAVEHLYETLTRIFATEQVGQ